MKDTTILKVEEISRDGVSARRALKNSPIAEKNVAARGAFAAPDYPFVVGGKYAWWETGLLPQFVFTDSKLPGVEGLQVLRRIWDAKNYQAFPGDGVCPVCKTLL